MELFLWCWRGRLGGVVPLLAPDQEDEEDGQENEQDGEGAHLSDEMR